MVYIGPISSASKRLLRLCWHGVCEQLWLQQLRNWWAVRTLCLLLRWLLSVINGGYQQITIGYFPPSKYHRLNGPLCVALV